MKISELTPEQIRRLAPLVPTSEATLRQIVKGHRGASARKAIAIEHAATRIGLEVRREALNEGCRVCEFARACRQVQKEDKP